MQEKRREKVKRKQNILSVADVVIPLLDDNGAYTRNYSLQLTPPLP